MNDKERIVCGMLRELVLEHGEDGEEGGTDMGKIAPANVAALIHYDMVTDPRNGYSQAPERWGGDHQDGVKVLDIDGRHYAYKLGSYDCSSSVITAWRQALRYTAYEGALDNATYTGDMRSVFVNSGLFTASLTPAKRGDLYLNEGTHVALCQDGGSDGVMGYDALSEFNRNEFHGATNGQVGDQDGEESVVRGYYDDGWNTVLHYVGGMLDDVSVKPDPKIKEETAMQCMIQCDDKIYYWDGSPECVPYHVSPSEKAAIEEVHKKVTGKDLTTISMARDKLNALVGMSKARKQWREQLILDAIKVAKDAVIAKVEEFLGKVE